eukprot:8150794-Alexandrium_andersonii.AAC.1
MPMACNTRRRARSATLRSAQARARWAATKWVPALPAVSCACPKGTYMDRRGATCYDVLRRARTY